MTDKPKKKKSKGQKKNLVRYDQQPSHIRHGVYLAFKQGLMLFVAYISFTDMVLHTLCPTSLVFTHKMESGFSILLFIKLFIKSLFFFSF